jgi:hypothetical protein
MPDLALPAKAGVIQQLAEEVAWAIATCSWSTALRARRRTPVPAPDFRPKAMAVVRHLAPGRGR